MSEIDADLVSDAIKLLNRARKLDDGSREAVRHALTHLHHWTPESVPEQFDKSNDYYTKGDEKAPFLSEAYLYVLLGKSDARTLLALMSALARACGFDDRDRREFSEKEPEEGQQLLCATGQMRGQVLMCRDFDALRRMQRDMEWDLTVKSVWLPKGKKVEAALAKFDKDEADEKKQRGY